MCTQLLYPELEIKQKLMERKKEEVEKLVWNHGKVVTWQQQWQLHKVTQHLNAVPTIIKQILIIYYSMFKSAEREAVKKKREEKASK